MRFTHITLLFSFLPLFVFAQKFSHQQIARDAKALERILFKVHPQPFAYIPADSIRRRLHDMQEFEGDSIKGLEWEIRIRRLLISVGCGHTYITGIAPSKKSVRKKRYALPFRVFSDGNKAWVTGDVDSTGKVPVPPGSWLIEIDHKPVDSLLGIMHLHQSTDGYNRTFNERLLNKDLIFNYLYMKYFSADSLHQVSFLTPGAELLSATVKGVRDKDLYTPEPARDSTIKILYHTRKSDQTFYYQPGHPEIGVLKIAAFHGKGSRLYKKAVRNMRKTKAKYLVIDMRDNTGGSFSSSVNLIRHVADKPFSMRVHRRLFRSWRNQPILNHWNRFNAFLMFDIFNPNPRWIKDHKMIYKLKYKPFRRRRHFDGQVFLLTNGLSFSASSQTATYIKALSSAVIIGNETGGGAAANNGMQIPIFKLPESGLRIRVPQFHLDYQLGPDAGRGVMPDIPTHYTIEDVLENRDLEWEAVFRYIGQHPANTDQKR